MIIEELEKAALEKAGHHVHFLISSHWILTSLPTLHLLFGDIKQVELPVMRKGEAKSHRQRCRVARRLMIYQVMSHYRTPPIFISAISEHGQEQ